MAIVRFGGGVSEMRGSIAGNVFSRSRSGATVRNRIKPVNPNTVRQSDVRSMFNTVKEHFQNLAAGEINSWAEYSQTKTRLNKLGESYVPSGPQLHMEINLNMLISGLPLLTVAPAGDQVEPSIDGNSSKVDILAGGGAGDPITSFLFTDLAQTDVDFVVVQATYPRVAAVRNFGGQYRQIDVRAIGDAGPTDEFKDEYNATFDSPPATTGLGVGVRIRGINSNSGLSTEWIYLDTTEAAP